MVPLKNKCVYHDYLGERPLNEDFKPFGCNLRSQRFWSHKGTCLNVYFSPNTWGVFPALLYHRHPLGVVLFSDLGRGQVKGGQPSPRQRTNRSTGQALFAFAPRFWQVCSVTLLGISWLGKILAEAVNLRTRLLISAESLRPFSRLLWLSLYINQGLDLLTAEPAKQLGSLFERFSEEASINLCI